MKKIFSLLLSFSLLLASVLPLLFLSATPVFAAGTCKLTLDPAKVTSDDTRIQSLTIEAPGVQDGKAYAIRIGTVYGSEQFSNQKFTNRKVVLSQINAQGIPVSSTGGDVSNGLLYTGGSSTVPFAPGVYSIDVADQGFFGKLTETTICKATFTVEKGIGNKCVMQFPDPNIKANQDIKIQLTGLDPKSNYITYVQESNEKGKTVADICHTGAEYEAAEGVSLGSTLSDGAYYVSVFPSGTGGCGEIAKQITTFRATTLSSGELGLAKSCSGLILVPGFAIGAGTPNAATLSGFLSFTGVISSPCKDIGTSTNPHYECVTAIGTIDTDPVQFVKRIFGLLLGISGGIALLLIINAGYHIMTSQGNPEKLQGARETITSAIIGLVFIIFSLAILQIIGVDILRIPGFGK